jgi:hypothetical protein
MKEETPVGVDHIKTIEIVTSVILFLLLLHLEWKDWHLV